MLRGLLVLLGLGLTLYALIDCIRTDESVVQGVPKPLWLLVIVTLPVVGPIAWLLVGRPRAQPGPARRPGPVAPDDDPEFLRQIERQRRQEAEDERFRRMEEDLRRRDQDGDGREGPDDGGRRA